MTGTEENKELVRRYLQAFNERDHGTLADLLAEDVVEHGVHEELHGADEVREFLESHFETFPDYTGSTDAVVAEDDTVVVRYTARGTRASESETGGDRTAEWTGMAMYRVEDERITEVWLEENRLRMLEQLDAVEPPAHLRL
jgi:steroid delta-isomerase-like uncharacterized protein